MSFSLKFYMSFNPYYEHTTELYKQHCPDGSCLPTVYIPPGKFTLLYNTTHCVPIDYVLPMSTLYIHKGQDKILLHHVVQVDKPVHVKTV